ncbi:MAG: nucleoid-associated protein [Deltaproteobacteria bacterium]
MRPLLRNLQIQELIVHDIPQKYSKRILRETPDTPILQPMFSQIASPINAEIIRFFHDKITGTIGSTLALDVIFNPLSESPIRRLVYEYFNGDINRHIAITQEIAQYLFDSQNAINSGGLLLFVKCTEREKPMLAILKVEKEEGVRIRQQIVQDGLMTFNVEHIRDLMLTKKTKLFKIVMFYLIEDSILGVLSDPQNGFSNSNVADFFLKDFLGCMLTEDPQIQTKKYYEITQKYINEKLVSAEQKGAMLNHLISELTAQTRTVSPVEFARRVLPVENRDEYIQFIRENGVAAGSFAKECSLIQSKLNKIQYEFISGISIFGSQEAINAKSKVNDLENGEMKIEITDRLKQVRAK